MWNLVNAEKCLALIPKLPKRILVVGCGSQGEDIKAFDTLLGEGKCEFVGVDIDEDTGREYCRPNVMYIRSDIATLPVVSSNFCLAYSFATFEHIADLRAGWQRMLDLLKPGGLMYVVSSPLWCTPYGHHKKNIFDGHPWIHLRYPSPEQLISYCKQKNIMSRDGIDIAHHVRYMLNSNYFNMLKSSAYIEAAELLVGGKIIANRFDSLPDDAIIGNEDLLECGYKKDDLTAMTHYLTIIKNNPFAADATNAVC